MSYFKQLAKQNKIAYFLIGGGKKRKSPSSPNTNNLPKKAKTSNGHSKEVAQIEYKTINDLKRIFNTYDILELQNNQEQSIQPSQSMESSKSIQHTNSIQEPTHGYNTRRASNIKEIFQLHARNCSDDKKRIEELEQILFGQPQLVDGQVPFGTPNVKKMGHLFTPRTVRFLSDIKETGGEEEEEDFIPMPEDERLFGKIIELWLTDNMTCPICGEYTLRCYYNNNMPVIDYICINKKHNITKGPIYWQVKTSKGAKYWFLGWEKYFDMDSKHIFVGSRNYGNVIHNIKPNSNEDDKNLLIGYILITYLPDETIENPRIEIKKLDIVYPNWNYNINIPNNENDWYYRYIDVNSDKSKIEFNPDTCFITEHQTKSMSIDMNAIISLINPTYEKRKNPYDVNSTIQKLDMDVD